MSKIRQAVQYERRLVDAKLLAQRDYLQQATAYEHELGVQKFHEVQTIQDSHASFHDREHLLYEDAIEKASASIRAQLAAMQLELDRLAEVSTNFMSTGRFEREHAQLVERIDAAFARVDEKLGAEERVTVRQGAQSELLEKLAVNNRWLVGLSVTVVLTLGVALLNWFRVV